MNNLFINNAGKSSGYPFVIAYLFCRGDFRPTVFCGSIDRIRRIVSRWKTCHGIYHVYCGGIVYKEWTLFGEKASSFCYMTETGKASLFHINSRDDKYRMRKFGLKFNGTRYVLMYNDKVIRTYRKLPSTYLRELDKI